MLVQRAIGIIFGIMEFAILARVLLSWLPVPREHRAVQMLYTITEPVLAPVRNLIARSSFGRNMMFDFSPVVALILVDILKNIIVSVLR